ncbi:amidohydrolase family protein [Sphingomonas cannabina]|uniref:amidohydrolase family protein n=1 Tax=Sphingomonas cannabina TaxID=2899123 RepID=UPI001F35639F|nr:amidohydrolase family protein [Sphingomonas cannabina]UIJ45329.1 amidohydrolase family protein [Sphingomonas cannabina]
MRVLDAHQHFWRIGGPGQSWPDAEWPRIHRDFVPDDLRSAAAGIDLVGSVLVQSQPDDRDTDWMCEIAGDDATVKAIVGWVDFDRADATTRIAELARRPKLRGLRPMLQAIDDSDWILGLERAPAIEAMIAHGLRFDALVQPRHLAPLLTFARRWPELAIVIDHGAKPFAARGELDPWREEIAALAELPNVWCKLSGLRTEQAPGQPAAALQSYVAHLVRHFPGRLLWGSDWPVLLHAGDSYADWVHTAYDLAAPVDAAARDELFVGAARRFYAIGEADL